MKNICFEIVSASKHFEDQVAILEAPARTITFGNLRQAVINFANYLAGQGISKESCIAIDVWNHVDAIISILAVGLAGGSWVRAVPALWSTQSISPTHLLSRQQPTTAISQVKWINLGDALSVNSIESTGSALHVPSGDVSDTDIWFLAQTSGTTGTPKFIGLTYENYHDRTNRYLQTHDFSPVITACLFPPLGGPWVSYNLRTLFLKGVLVFGGDFEYLVQQGVHKVFGSPLHFDSFLSQNDGSRSDMLPIAHVAGAKPSKALIVRLLEKFHVIHNFYGSVEVGGVARKIISNIDDDRACVGKILAGNEVAILSEQCEPISDGLEGFIGVRNDIMAKGYINEPLATDACFMGGWFISGDKGYLNQAGELCLSSRSEEIVNLDGVKVTLTRYDDILTGLPGVEDAICFMMRDADGDGVVMSMIKLANGSDVEKTILLIRDAFNDYPRALTLRGYYLVDQIPRNSEGKASRYEAIKIVAMLNREWLYPVKFKDNTYDFHSISSKGQDSLRYLRILDNEIETCKAEIALYQTARNYYAHSVSTLLMGGGTS